MVWIYWPELLSIANMTTNEGGWSAKCLFFKFVLVQCIIFGFFFIQIVQSSTIQTVTNVVFLSEAFVLDGVTYFANKTMFFSHSHSSLQNNSFFRK